MYELLIIFLLVVSFLPSMITFFVLGGALHAFAIVLCDYAREILIYFRHDHATSH